MMMNGVSVNAPHMKKNILVIKHKINQLDKEEQDNIRLLKKENVVSWIHGNTEFLDPENPIVSHGYKYIDEDTNKVYKYGTRKGQPKIKKKKVIDKDKPIFKYNKGQLLEKRRENEAKWNMELMKEVRPDLFNKEHSQSSLFGPFGEILVKEYCILKGGFKTDKPEKKGGHELDLETDNNMIEVKTCSYFTTGTAREKIFGVPWKYADVPRLYHKPLLIILLGGDEKKSELVCKSNVPEREDMKKYWESKHITFTCFKRLLNNL